MAAGCPADARDNALNTPLHLASGAPAVLLVSAAELVLRGGLAARSTRRRTWPRVALRAWLAGPVEGSAGGRRWPGLDGMWDGEPARWGASHECRAFCSAPAGCGFLDTVVALVELGADVNARDITDCTPLQNAAHGTYSALASVPASPAAAAAPLPPPAATATGYARLNPPHQPQLTPAQQAAQAAITASERALVGGWPGGAAGCCWSRRRSEDGALVGYGHALQHSAPWS